MCCGVSWRLSVRPGSLLSEVYVQCVQGVGWCAVLNNSLFRWVRPIRAVCFVIDE
jgi:hypothetical protein